jgi:hypothetical protein
MREALLPRIALVPSRRTYLRQALVLLRLFVSWVILVEVRWIEAMD